MVESLAINPNTVAKAYRQLEQEGLVSGRPGQGTFVTAAGVVTVSPAVYSSLRRGLEGWLRRAYTAGLDEHGVAALFATVHHGVRAEGVA